MFIKVIDVFEYCVLYEVVGGDEFGVGEVVGVVFVIGGVCG